MSFTPRKILVLQFVTIIFSVALIAAFPIVVAPMFFIIQIYLYSKLIACTCPDCGANFGSHLQNMSLSNGKCLKCNKLHNT